MPQNDECHGAHAAGGAAIAFEAAYRHYYAGVYAFMRRSTGNAAVAEELAAEVFARLAGNLQYLHDQRRPLRAWLYVVARNLVIDYRRRHGRISCLPLDECLAEIAETCLPQVAEQRLEYDRLLAAMSHLTEPQRQVILLKFVEGYSNAEAGAILGKDENSIKSLQHRALVTLRKVLCAP